jgi:hypothetical protein
MLHYRHLLLWDGSHSHWCYLDGSYGLLHRLDGSRLSCNCVWVREDIVEGIVEREVHLGTNELPFKVP